MNQKLKFTILGYLSLFSLYVAFTGAVYGHLWLTEFTTAQETDLGTVFFDDIEHEQHLMGLFRLVGGVSAIVLVGVNTAVEQKLLALQSDPSGWIRSRLTGGAGLVLVGVAGFVFTSELTLEAVSICFILVGVLSIVTNAIRLSANL